MWCHNFRRGPAHLDPAPNLAEFSFLFHSVFTYLLYIVFPISQPQAWLTSSLVVGSLTHCFAAFVYNLICTIWNLYNSLFQKLICLFLARAPSRFSGKMMNNGLKRSTGLYNVANKTNANQCWLFQERITSKYLTAFALFDSEQQVSS